MVAVEGATKQEHTCSFPDYFPYIARDNYELENTATKGFQDWFDTYNLTINNKGDEILEHFNYICKVIKPSSQDYFPEMEVNSGLYTNLHRWKRI